MEEEELSRNMLMEWILRHGYGQEERERESFLFMVDGMHDGKVHHYECMVPHLFLACSSSPSSSSGDTQVRFQVHTTDLKISRSQDLY